MADIKSKNDLNEIDIFLNTDKKNETPDIKISKPHLSNNQNYQGPGTSGWENKKFEEYADFETVDAILKGNQNNKAEEDSDYKDEQFIQVDKEEPKETTNHEAAPEVKESLYEQLKKEIKDVRNNLSNIFVRNKKERNLNQETGGMEIDYKKIQEDINKDKDLWDVKENKPDTIESSFESSQMQSFIHRKKKGKGHNAKKMGQMTLSDKHDIKMSHVKRLQKLRLNKEKDGFEQEGGNGMSF